MPSQVLVDAVVDGFPNEMVQTGTVVNVTDVHPRPLANGFEPLEDRDVLGTVGGVGGTHDGRRGAGFGHSNGLGATLARHPISGG
jgi:hypothetical protein